MGAFCNSNSNSCEKGDRLLQTCLRINFYIIKLLISLHLMYMYIFSVHESEYGDMIMFVYVYMYNMCTWHLIFVSTHVNVNMFSLK